MNLSVRVSSVQTLPCSLCVRNVLLHNRATLGFCSPSASSNLVRVFADFLCPLLHFLASHSKNVKKPNPLDDAFCRFDIILMNM